MGTTLVNSSEVHNKLVKGYVDDLTGGNQGLSGFIANAYTSLKVSNVGGECIPTTVTHFSLNTQTENCSYVVSPISSYVHYAREEISRLNKPITALPLKGVVAILNVLVRLAKLDNTIMFNNWMLSTNIYPLRFDRWSLALLRDNWVGKYPEHALVFRSLNQRLNQHLIADLKALGFILVPSRQVYIFDLRASDSLLKDHHNNVMDAKLLKKTHYQIVDASEFSELDYKQAEWLYRDLYVNKYSHLNPQYTCRWLSLGVRSGWLQLKGLKNSSGRLDGVVGWFIQGEVMTAPIVGYDTSLNKKLGLYRLLTQMCLQKAAKERYVLNFSSGASGFKILRGGSPEVEYSAVYIKHLPVFKKLVWTGLSKLLLGLAVPIMRRWRL